MDFLDDLERKARGDDQALMGYLGTEEQTVIRERQVKLDLLGLRDQGVRKVTLACQVFKVKEVLRVLLANLAHKDQWDQLVREDALALSVCQARKDQRDNLERKETEVQWE